MSELGRQGAKHVLARLLACQKPQVSHLVCCLQARLVQEDCWCKRSASDTVVDDFWHVSFRGSTQ